VGGGVRWRDYDNELRAGGPVVEWDLGWPDWDAGMGTRAMIGNCTRLYGATFARSCERWRRAFVAFVRPQNAK